MSCGQRSPPSLARARPKARLLVFVPAGLEGILVLVPGGLLVDVLGLGPSLGTAGGNHVPRVALTLIHSSLDSRLLREIDAGRHVGKLDRCRILCGLILDGAGLCTLFLDGADLCTTVPASCPESLSESLGESLSGIARPFLFGAGLCEYIVI